MQFLRIYKRPEFQTSYEKNVVQVDGHPVFFSLIFCSFRKCCAEFNFEWTWILTCCTLTIQQLVLTTQVTSIRLPCISTLDSKGLINSAAAVVVVIITVHPCYWLFICSSLIIAVELCASCTGSFRNGPGTGSVMLAPKIISNAISSTLECTQNLQAAQSFISTLLWELRVCLLERWAATVPLKTQILPSGFGNSDLTTRCLAAANKILDPPLYS